MGAAWGAGYGLACPVAAAAAAVAAAAAAAAAAAEARHAVLQHTGWGPARQPLLTLGSEIRPYTLSRKCNKLIHNRHAER